MRNEDTSARSGVRRARASAIPADAHRRVAPRRGASSETAPPARLGGAAALVLALFGLIAPARSQEVPGSGEAPTSDSIGRSARGDLGEPEAAESGEANDAGVEIEEFLELEAEWFDARSAEAPLGGVGVDLRFESLVTPPELAGEAQGPRESDSLVAHDSLPPLEPPTCFDPTGITSLPFELDSVEHPPLLAFLEFYCTEGRRRVGSWFSRAGRYRAMIEEEAARQGAPAELLWVAAIESGFEPEARSSRGAVGLWQWRQQTARGAGLRIDRFVDERLDPVTSTRVALEYLVRQHDRFGTWPLALAAYNAGSGHVRGEIREYSATDFWAMDDYGMLWDDARAYALRAMALAVIAANPEAFAMDSVVPEAPREWDEIEVRPGLRLSLVAGALDVDLSVIRELNPALIRSQTPPDETPWRVRIPLGATGEFIQEFDDYAERYGDEHELVRLRFGEDIDALAGRLGLPERVLRHANGLGSDDRVPYLTELIAPTSGRAPADEEPSPEALPVVPLPRTVFRYSDRVQVFYEVLGWDTAREIADHFGVSLDELCAWNDLDPQARLWSSMTLQIWIAPDFDLGETIYLRADQVRAIPLGSAEWDAWQWEQEQRSSRSGRRYTVRSGDTVNALARRFGVRPSDLIRWNDLDEDATIVVGQELVVGR